MKSIQQWLKKVTAFCQRSVGVSLNNSNNSILRLCKDAFAEARVGRIWDWFRMKHATHEEPFLLGWLTGFSFFNRFIFPQDLPGAGFSTFRFVPIAIGIRTWWLLALQRACLSTLLYKSIKRCALSIMRTQTYTSLVEFPNRSMKYLLKSFPLTVVSP